MKSPEPKSRLKPCPFCGAAGMWAASLAADDFEIQCSRYTCPVLIICGGKTEQECIDNWNGRVDPRRRWPTWALVVALAIALLWLAERGASR